MNRAVLATVLTLASAAAFAAGTSAGATATASVKIRKAITLSGTNLDFGGIVISAAGTATDTATLSPANVLTAPGTNGTIVGTFNTTAPATFTVGGTKSATYAITLPADGVVTLAGPGAPLSVDSWTGSKATGTLSALAGSDTFTVGATLKIPQTTTDGDYSGSFTVTVAYN